MTQHYSSMMEVAIVYEPKGFPKIDYNLVWVKLMDEETRAQ